jgi:PhoPQ-activated pathogenicity-related protein
MFPSSSPVENFEAREPRSPKSPFLGSRGPALRSTPLLCVSSRRVPGARSIGIALSLLCAFIAACQAPEPAGRAAPTETSLSATLADADSSSPASAASPASGAEPLAAPAEALPARTALDDYVETADDVYKWSVAAEESVEGAKIYFIDMTSQNWLTPADVDRTTWRHWLVVTWPKDADPSHAFLFIGGGSHKSDRPKGPDKLTVAIAQETGMIVAELRGVPNQPLVFHQDGKERSEDDLIAYAWRHFIESGDDRWVPRMPMVKSAVRAMDTVQALAREKGKLEIGKFIVAGGSKRGWTTWLTGLDRRVAAIAPIVIDVLNVRPSLDHHYAAYGFWAPAIGDYVHHRIVDFRKHPRYDVLLGLVDPFAYRHRLKMPKYIVNASGDQFFLPDSSKFYFDALQGEKHLRYVPNADHSLRDTDAAESLAAFSLSVIRGEKRPEYSWSFEADGSIRVIPKDAPTVVKLWKATNPNARDFRLEAIGKVWQEETLELRDDGSYIGRVAAPEHGFTAYFVELTYPGIRRASIKFTSGVRVVPDVLPHADALRALDAEPAPSGANR